MGDNGFASFDHVIIPRRNMAMGFATVDKNGVYATKSVSDATSKISYITMMDVRVLIIKDSGMCLGRACTIVLRYSVQRRQGFMIDGDDDGENTKELQVL